MHDVVFVAVGQGREDVRCNALQLIQIHRRLPSGLQLMQVISKVAVTQLHHEIYRRARHYDIMKLHDVGVPQCAEHCCFAQQCDRDALMIEGGRSLVDSFDCDVLLRLSVVSTENRAA